MEQKWHEKIMQYCEDYNIPLYYLAEILKNPKVVPMIRGISFEFTVFEKLRNILDSRKWDVIKPNINAQLNKSDVDILIRHKMSGKEILVECKLAKKEGCKISKNKAFISVKCMRSRTLGTEMVKNLAPKWGVTEKMLAVHNDQYLPTNFDFVITSIGNTFYRTDEKGIFLFQPDEKEMLFLRNFSDKNLKEQTFHQLYIAKSSEISIVKQNKIKCTRRGCSKKENCGFIPNYPIIEFSLNSLIPINNWHSLENCEKLFTEFICI